MDLKVKQTSKLLYAVEGVGIIFAALFCAAYLLGLPGTEVLHSELWLRIPLAIFGGILLILAIALLLVAATSKNQK